MLARELASRIRIASRNITRAFWFYGGPLSGKETTFITPGVVLGYFQIAERLHIGVGGGMQIAVTRFHTYNHRWIWSMRFPF